jgi:hypothetical protein
VMVDTWSCSIKGVATFLSTPTLPQNHHPSDACRGLLVVERQMARSRNSQLLTTAEAAELLRLKPHTLENMRCDGTGPLFRKHGCRVFYLRSEIRAWSKQRRRQIASGSTV